MPPGLIEDQGHAVLRIDGLIPDKGGEREGERLSADRGQQAPPTVTGGGADEAVDREPLVPSPDGGVWPLALGRPDPFDARR